MVTRYTLNRIVAIAALLIGAAGMSAGPAMGASQGNRGKTSTGSVGVQAEVAQMVQITDLADIAFGSFAGSTLNESDNVCVWSNTGGYDITATSDTGSGAFEMDDASGSETLSYNVSWADSAGASSGTALSEGTAQTGFGGTFNGPNCGGGGTNATLLLELPGTNANADTPPGTYNDTLTIEVSPQ